jgi:hypothetical protein
VKVAAWDDTEKLNDDIVAAEMEVIELYEWVASSSVVS